MEIGRGSKSRTIFFFHESLLLFFPLRRLKVFGFFSVVFLFVDDMICMCFVSDSIFNGTSILDIHCSGFAEKLDWNLREFHFIL